MHYWNGVHWFLSDERNTVRLKQILSDCSMTDGACIRKTKKLRAFRQRMQRMKENKELEGFWTANAKNASKTGRWKTLRRPSTSGWVMASINRLQPSTSAWVMASINRLRNVNLVFKFAHIYHVCDYGYSPITSTVLSLCKKIVRCMCFKRKMSHAVNDRWFQSIDRKPLTATKGKMKKWN